MDKSTQKTVVFVTKSGFQFFSSAGKAVLSYSFDEKIVRDLDVIDAPSLQKQIQAFVDQNKLIPSIIIFLFAEPTCFYQDLKETDEAKLKSQTAEFVNTVPFETLLTRVYKTNEGVRAVSINEKLYREIAQGFETKGFVSLGVVPSFVLGDKIGVASALDANIARRVLANIDQIREQSFLWAAETEGEETPEEEKGAEKSVVEKGFKITRNLIILAVVFVVLVVVLVFLILRQ